MRGCESGDANPTLAPHGEMFIVRIQAGNMQSP